MSARLRNRTAEPNPNPAAPPAATPPTDPARHRTAANPPATPPVASRSAVEIRTEHARAIAEADQLQARSRTAALSAEEQARLLAAVDTAEQLAVELDAALLNERLAAQRQRATAPSRPAAAPMVHVAPARNQVSEEEGLRLWLASFGGGASAENVYRARAAGFEIGQNSARLAVNYERLNSRRRTVSKIADPGNDWVPVTYSDKVTEYLTFFSRIVGMVDSETTTDGNDRTYFIVNDTSMMSTHITDSGGTEIAPTIPEADPVLGSKVIKAQTITSGYHKITREAARDTAVSVTDRLAKAIGNSHARKIERDVILGNGTTEAEGIITSGTRYGSAVDDINEDLMDEIFFNVPEQYRDGCVWLMHSTTQAKLRKKLKDGNDRTLFSDSLEGDRRILRYGGLPVITSSYMPAWGANAKVISLVNPMFYLLRLVAGQQIDVLTEKFHPHLAYAGLMAFGGGYLGPTTANQYLQLDAGPEGT